MFLKINIFSKSTKINNDNFVKFLFIFDATVISWNQAKFFDL